MSPHLFMGELRKLGEHTGDFQSILPRGYSVLIGGRMERASLSVTSKTLDGGGILSLRVLQLKPSGHLRAQGPRKWGDFIHVKPVKERRLINPNQRIPRGARKHGGKRESRWRCDGRQTVLGVVGRGGER